MALVAGQAQPLDLGFEFNMEVPFSSARLAGIAHGTLAVDEEPNQNSKRTIAVNEKILTVHIAANQAKVLRVSVGSFMDHLGLVLETMDQFDPQGSESESA